MSLHPTPPEGFTWEQPDALELRCERCAEVVRAEVVDIHLSRCGGRS